MPEIWVPYGSVEVAVDIKIENILEVIERPPHALTDDEVKQKLSQINFVGRIGIFVVDDLEPCIKTAKIIAKSLQEKNIPETDVQFIAPRKSAGSVRKRLEGISYKVSTAQIAENKPVGDIFSDASTKVLVSQIGFDGLFGFSGGLISMMRAVENEIIGKAFFEHPIELPSSGMATEALRMVWEIADQLTDIQSISVIPSQGDISDVAIGDLQRSRRVAEEKFLAMSTKSIPEKARAAIVSSGRGAEGESLSSSVRALWNILGGLRDRSTIVLLAECNEGLGAEAFKLYGTGRLDSADLPRLNKYIEGIEDLIFLREVAKRHEVVVVSSLPNYYVENRFNLRSAKKSSDALNYLLSSQGSRAKVVIVPQASETLLKA